MTRRNQRNRRRTYGRRQHEVRERRAPGAPGDEPSGTHDEAWTDWLADGGDDPRGGDDGRYGYAR
jgi:hypothetical protein